MKRAGLSSSNSGGGVLPVRFTRVGHLIFKTGVELSGSDQSKHDTSTEKKHGQKQIVIHGQIEVLKAFQTLDHTSNEFKVERRAPPIYLRLWLFSHPQSNRLWSG